MSDAQPWLDEARLADLVDQAVRRCQLNLAGRVVFTEAASGAYAATALAAARAGGRVFALARSTAWGTVEEVADLTRRLARRLGVADCVEVIEERRRELIEAADIVTNSGHVRPIDAELIEALRPGAAVPLMYESWALRPGEVDVEACRRRGVHVAGTNERHPHIDMYPCLGPMSARLLADAGVALQGSEVLVVCDNAFIPFLRAGLAAAGVGVEVVSSVDEAETLDDFDALLIALTPRGEAVVGPREAALISARWPGALVAQFWGDLDRAALAVAGVPYWPVRAPAAGHMGILPTALGLAPIARLQVGGLKVGEVLLRQPPPSSADWEYVDAVSGHVSETRPGGTLGVGCGRSTDSP